MTDGQAKPVTDADASALNLTPEQQALMNQKIKERLERVDSKYAGFDDLKREAEQLRLEKQEREEKEKTERQKEIDAAVKAHDKKLRDEFGTKERRLNLDRAIELEFIQQGKDPELRHMLVGDFAVASPEDVKEKIDAFLAAKPYLNTQTMQKGIATGGSPNSPASPAPGATLRVSRARILEMARTDTWVGSPEQKAEKQGLLDVID